MSKRTSRNTGASNFGNGTRLDMTYNGQIGGPTGPTGPNGVARFMTYDYANRLVSAQLAGGLHALYTYDALARRIQRDVAPPGPPIVFTTRFAYDGASVIEERDSGGTLQASFSPGSESFDSYRAVGDLPERLDGMETGSFSMRRGGQDYWLHADNTGTVFALTDASGAVVERYDYDNFGEVQFLNPAGAPIPGATQSAAGNPYLFRGLRYEPEPRFFLSGGTTGKYPEYHKVWEDGALRAVPISGIYWDPQAARFTTKDAKGSAHVGGMLVGLGDGSVRMRGLFRFYGDYDGP